MAASKKQDRVLRRQSDFESLKETGLRLQPVPWLLLNYKRTEVGHFRYGMTISRKVGPAVLRNRLKRWVREYFRKSPLFLQLQPEPSMDVNVVFRPAREEFYTQLAHASVDSALDAFVKRAVLARASSR